MRVLLIDDDKLTLDTVGGFLRELGHTVTMYQSKDALYAIGSQPSIEWDLFIVDHLISYTKFTTMLAAMQNCNRDVPTVIMTHLNTILSVRDAMTFNVWGYLRKPISLKEIELMLIRFEEMICQPTAQRFKGERKAYGL